MVVSLNLHIFCLLLSSSLLINAQIVEIPVANLSTTWINSPLDSLNSSNWDGLRTVLLRGSFGPRFVCGFLCQFRNGTCFFTVSIFQTRTGVNPPFIEFPEAVWTANRNTPVKINATLQLSQEGDLILRDTDGTYVWSTNTTSLSVSGLNLTEEGNLVLFSRNNAVVWQSFDHPTDSLLPGQRMVSGQKLIATESASNLTEAQFIRFDSDGHLRVYEWGGSSWKQVSDVLLYLGACDYPFVCGNYGICSNGQCSCPGADGTTNLFRQVDGRQPNLGCTAITPISCNSSESQSFLEIKDLYYFAYRFSIDINNTDMETCKQACLKNCSCKLALFRYKSNASSGDCVLLSDVFSIINNEQQMYYYNTSALFKVQNATKDSSAISPKSRKNQVAIIVGSTLGAVFGVSLTVGIFLFLRFTKDYKEIEEDYLDQLPGMPTRYSYEDLKSATENFSSKLGEGGFGAVFQGTLPSGIKVAVKCLTSFGQEKKSFFAEVESIGSIHHVHLARLIGFCAETLHRLLVYEYMCNGSLDKWIFHRVQESPLDWQTRRNIVLNVAKGLAYLHEECRQKIIHLDIKPENILLDENFNAKISDFGLSKLIERDQSQVVTTMRGTPGYMAPVWLNSGITEKVDVYSFGVVVMEVCCGRKNMDLSQPEEDMHLLNLFKRKAEEGQLLDMVDKSSEDMQLHGAEVVNMLRVAAWCLQSHFIRRPSMSVVVKVLEGVMHVEDNLDYNFSSPPALREKTAVVHNEGAVEAATPLLPEELSGPR
ncbi:hypothetical protein ACB092_06G169800 [Castanea dentata]